MLLTAPFESKQSVNIYRHQGSHRFDWQRNTNPAFHWRRGRILSTLKQCYVTSFCLKITTLIILMLQCLATGWMVSLSHVTSARGQDHTVAHDADMTYCYRPGICVYDSGVPLRNCGGRQIAPVEVSNIIVGRALSMRRVSVDQVSISCIVAEEEKKIPHP